MKKLLLSLGLSVSLLGSAYALDSLEPGSVVYRGPMAGGIICDTEAEVRETILNFDTPDYVFPPGCGRLMRPLLGTAVLIEDVLIEHRVFRLVQYTFDPAPARGNVLPIQFGVWRMEEVGQGA